MLHAVLLILISLLFVGLISSLMFWGYLLKWLKERRRKRLASLKDYRRRLQYVLSGLLARVNEIDQESSYASIPMDTDCSKRLAVACSQLLTLGESVNLVEQLLEIQDVQGSEEIILICCREAHKISSELGHIQRVGTDAQKSLR